MPVFWYQALSKDGKRLTGFIEAHTPNMVREKLSSQGLYPISVIIQNSNEVIQGNWLQRLFASSMTLQDKIFFTKQLALLLKSGIALADALDLMKDQIKASLRGMIQKMRDELKEGAQFATVLSKYPKSFSKLYIQLVKAGEASGQMEKVLLRLAGFLEEEAKFNAQVSDAVRGPLIQMVLVFVVSGFLLTFIVPQIAEVFKDIGGTRLPSLTRAVLALSDALLHNYIIIILLVLVVIAIFQAIAQSAWGSLLFDKLKLKIPMISYLTRKVAIVQFAQTLGLLLESGVDIAEALDIVVTIVNNQVLVTALKKARDDIIKQGRVADYLAKTGLFANVDIHLIATGEQSGALDVMLTQVGKYNQDDVTQFSQGLTAILNPLAMLILAVVVGTIMFAVMSPIFNIQELMKK